MRADPFIRAPAMHTGLDIRADTGEPARATAAGTVTMAGWNGGYGKMVEVDHGNGFATRYAHLSAIDVEVGQAVRIGQIVGKVGSTGRSTGPHLHYETRVDGDAVDPQRFLRAGVRLGGATVSPTRRNSELAVPICYSRARRRLGAIAMNTLRKSAIGMLAVLMLAGNALAAEARFLSFPDELRRARAAIGPDADCRVFVEEILARCELATAGTHGIQIQFADVSGSMLPRKSVILTRGTIEPQRFSGVLAAYGLPTEVVVPCISGEPGRPGAGYEAYVGDYYVRCDRDQVTITYARRF